MFWPMQPEGKLIIIGAGLIVRLPKNTVLQLFLSRVLSLCGDPKVDSNWLTLLACLGRASSRTIQFRKIRLGTEEPFA
jgi:hypothetical protein